MTLRGSLDGRIVGGVFGRMRGRGEHDHGHFPRRAGVPAGLLVKRYQPADDVWISPYPSTIPPTTPGRVPASTSAHIRGIPVRNGLFQP